MKNSAATIINKKLFLTLSATSAVALILTNTLIKTESGSKFTMVAQAAGTAQVCDGSRATDTMLIIDSSSSMKNPISSKNKTTRIDAAKAAADAFVDILAERTQTPLNRASVTSFSNQAKTKVIVPITQDFAKLHTGVKSITLDGGTCIECGIRTAVADLIKKDRSGIKNIAVLLSDGKPTQYIGGRPDTTPAGVAAASKKAYAAAVEAHKKQKVSFYTIGFGGGKTNQLMINIATSSGGQYFYAPDAEKLKEIYQNIAKIIGKGSVSGTVFNDKDADGKMGPTESILSGWEISVINESTGASVAKGTSTDKGEFTIPGLCDGTYKLKVTVKPGWEATVPVSPDYYPITISKGGSVENKYFGNIAKSTGSSLTCSPKKITLLPSTPTVISTVLKNSNGTKLNEKDITWTTSDPKITLNKASTKTNKRGKTTNTITTTNTSPSTNAQITANFAGDSQNAKASCTFSVQSTQATTLLTLSLLLHGIGSAGDNMNPTANSLSNKNPRHESRPVTLTFHDSNNKPVITQNPISQEATYNEETGAYPVSLEVPNTIAAGQYTVYISSPGYLTRRYPGIVTITPGKSSDLGKLEMVTGDVDRDDKLTVADYDIIVNCYSDFQPPKNCNDTNKEFADISDDGKVNSDDYVLFAREFSVQISDKPITPVTVSTQSTPSTPQAADTSSTPTATPTPKPTATATPTPTLGITRTQ